MSDAKDDIEAVVSVSRPAVPLWAIYADLDDRGSFFTIPVVTLALVRRRKGEHVIVPLCFNAISGVESAWEGLDPNENRIGFLLEDIKPDDPTWRLLAERYYDQPKSEVQRQKKKQTL
jgi:hypothetical protein